MTALLLTLAALAASRALSPGTLTSTASAQPDAPATAPGTVTSSPSAQLGARPPAAAAAARPRASSGEQIGAETQTSTRSQPPPEGFDWLVLPIFQYNDDAGFIYGLHFPFVQYGAGARPYEWYLELKLRHSTKNRHEHFLYLDIQRLLGLRWTIRGEFLRIDDANYFGVARRARVEDLEDPLYRYRLTEPRVQALVSERLPGGLVWSLGLGVNRTWTHYAGGSLLAVERPRGVDGGHAFIGLAALAYDSRDQELVPTRGLLLELYGKAASRPLGSSSSFQGVGLTAQAYHSPLPSLVLAQRLLLESLGGRLPFYELGRIGGRTNVFGLGGVYTQRGEPESRFIGAHKVLSNSEARYYFPRLFDRLTLGLTAFFDLSAVLDGGTLLERLVPSGGGELTVRWKELVLFRVDVGASAEGTLVYVEGRHLF